MEAEKRKQEWKMVGLLFTLVAIFVFFFLQGVNGVGGGAFSDDDSDSPDSYYTPAANNYYTEDGREIHSASQKHDGPVQATSTGTVVRRSGGKVSIKDDHGKTLTFVDHPDCPEPGKRVEFEFELGTALRLISIQELP